MSDALPSSLLKSRPEFGSVMADWKMPDGTTVRCECAMVYCANCGCEFGYVPLENTNFAFWLCNQCYEVYGRVAGTYVMPDDEFNQSVSYELERKFGRILTEKEVIEAIAQDKLSPELKALEKDSPYRNYNK